MKINLTDNVKNSVLIRDHYQCVECGSKENLNIHHVIPRKWGGNDIPSNLITLCRTCHSEKHIEYQTKYFSDIVFKLNNLFRKILLLPEQKDLEKLLFLLTHKTTFKKHQKEIIQAVLDGNDVLVVMPTGSGKSVCFQLPGLAMENQTMVITPLKALMKDQVEGLWQKRIPATFINSDLDQDEKENRLNLFKQKLFRFIYIAPEQFYDKYQDNKLKINHPLLQNKFDLLAIDEAHCIDKWGRSFRPSYSQLKELKNALGNPRTIALTASASKRVQQNIIDSLELKNPVVFVTGFYRPEIELYVKIFNGQKEEANEEKLKLITKIIEKYKDERIIIFVPTIKIGRLVWKELIKQDIDCEFFYGKQNKEDKIRIQDEYKGTVPSTLKVLICTSAFGMGVNIANIRIAIHWCISQNMEDYYQQIGRIGRDGRKSQAILLYGDGDINLIKYINEKSLQQSKKKLTEEEKTQIRKIEETELIKMIKYLKAPNKWQYILDYFGEIKTNKQNNNFNKQNFVLAGIMLFIALIINIYLFWIIVLVLFFLFLKENKKS